MGKCARIWGKARAGSESVWKQENGHFSKLTVIALEPQALLQLSLLASTWEQELAPANLPDGEKYYEASLEIGSSAAEKIKELAEQ